MVEVPKISPDVRVIIRATLTALANQEPSKSEFARKVNTTPSNVGHWLAGDTVPSLDKLVEISQIYELPLAAFTGTGPEGSSLALLPDEVELLEAYRTLPAKLKKAVGEILKELADA